MSMVTLKIRTGGFVGPLIAMETSKESWIPAIGDNVIVGSTRKKVLDREFDGYTRPAGYDQGLVVTLIVEPHPTDIPLAEHLM